MSSGKIVVHHEAWSSMKNLKEIEAESISAQISVDYIDVSYPCTSSVQELVNQFNSVYQSETGSLVDAINISLSLLNLEVYSSDSWAQIVPDSSSEIQICSVFSQYYHLTIVILSQSQDFITTHHFGLEETKPLILYKSGVTYFGTDSLLHLDQSESSDSDFSEDDQELENDFEHRIDLLNPILPQYSNISLMISYLINSEKFRFDTQISVLTAFSRLQNEFVLMVLALNQEMNMPHELLFKLYYKFRHNVFGYLCANSLVESKKFDTDMPLSKFGLDSKKTPDLILESESKLDIIEFTVANKYGTSDFYKGGGNRDFKYAAEAKELQNLINKTVRVTIVSAVLDEINLEELRNIITDLGGNFQEGFFRDFFDISNRNRHIINQGQIRSSNSVMLSTLDFKMKTYDRPPPHTTLMIPQELLSNLIRSVDRFKTQSMNIIKKSKNFYLELCYDIALNSVYMQYERKSKKKKSKKRKQMEGEEFLFGLKTNGYHFLLNNLNLYREGVKISFKEIRGSIPVTVSRTSSAWLEKMPDTSAYDNKMSSFNSYRWESEDYEILRKEGYRPNSLSQKVIFPPNYLDLLSTHKFNNILNSESGNMLANCVFDAKSLETCLVAFNEKQSRLNNDPTIMIRPKPTFLIPLPIAYKNTSFNDFKFLSEISHLNFTPYTSVLISKAEKGLFENTRDIPKNDLTVQSLREELNRANIAVYDRLNTHFDNFYGRKLNKAQKLFVKDERAAVEKAQKKYHDYLASLKGTRNEHLVKMGKGSKSQIRKDFTQEMKHYGGTKSVYKGVGAMDQNNYMGFDKYLKNFLSKLTEEVDLDVDPLFSSTRSSGPDLLNELKNQYTDRAVAFAKKNFLGKRIDGICTLYSRLAVHLFNESTKTYNSGYVKVDNLGLSDLIVFVKGGPKIYRHQRSRLYKIILRMSEEDARWGGILGETNFTSFKTENGYIVSTPWSQIHQDVLFDYMTLRERCFMNLFSAHGRSVGDMDQPPQSLSMLPFVLSLHNRRKTETFMHNSRYLIVNPLAKFANMEGLMPSFAGFNYTYLDAWLRKRLELSYFDFASTLMKARSLKGSRIDSILSSGNVKDLWLQTEITNADQLTGFIYITYMMSKAPVNSSIEQANNLWEILEDISLYNEVHPDVEGLVDVSQRFNLIEDGDEVYEDDFTYDPVFCNYLGHHLYCQLSGQLTLAEIANYWDSVKNQDLSEIANSNGLRGWNDKNFFGKKGFEIVYQKIEEELEEMSHDITFLDRIQDYLDSDPQTAYTKIKADKVTIDPDLAMKQLIFHIVHKLQRGGKREIFCMDLNTKSAQNPIEKMMKFLCKRVPNEFISIPSNKRHGLIHSDFYERKTGTEFKHVYRWVLDCRRWAPHSVFQKYVHFIEGLAPLLPSDFILYFRKFSEQMLKKEFITREHVYNKIKNNEKFKKYGNLLKASEVIAGAYTATVKFSFVMGIFNYLSTLMHAANQVVASEVIRNQCVNRGLGLVVLDAKCHSDDSVVSSYHEKPDSITLSLKMYDWLLKGANHMLSIKKSQVNEDVYLEFLSVLYLYDRFLPVLPKFSSTIPFKPSDKGFSSDISFAITQSMEMLSQGGSYEESFIIMKLTERFIQRIYRINVVEKLPHHMLGSIDSHPIEFLYAGGLADVYRCMKFSPEEFWRAYNLLSQFKLVEKGQAEFSLKWDMSSKLRNNQSDLLNKYEPILDNLEDESGWTINNLKLGNGVLNLLWYVNKIKDRSFYSSLVDEPSARKFARLFGSGSSRTVLSSDGVRHSVPKLGLDLNFYIENGQNSEPDYDFEEFMNFCCKDLNFFYKSMEGAKTTDLESSNYKEKPIVFFQSSSTLGTISVSAGECVSYLREPKGFLLLGKRVNPYREVNKVITQLDLLGVNHDKLSNDQLQAVILKMMKDERRSFRLVMPMPGDERKIDSYTSAIHSLSYNSFKWKKVGIISRHSSVVDWQRKIVSGQIPSSVVDFLELYWLIDLLQRHNVFDLDIKKDDIPDLNSLREKIPDEWGPILNSDLNPSKTLIEMPYWCCWVQEQVRVGQSWYGAGLCYISLPELILKMEVISGKITSMEFQTEMSGPLSTSSSWYLSIFLNTTGLQSDIAPRDFGNPDEIYLGLNKDGNFCIGRAKSLDSIYYDSKKRPNIIPSFCTRKMEFRKNGSKVVYRDMEREYPVNFFIPLEQPVILDLSKYLDKYKIEQQIRSNRRLNLFVQECASSIIGGSKKDLEVMMRNLDSTLIYNIIFNFSEKRRVFEGEAVKLPLMSAIVEWKRENPGFGFPNETQLESLAKQGQVSPFSPKILDMIQNLGYSNVTQAEFDGIVSKILALPTDEREHYLLNMFPNLGGSGQARSLVLLNKSDRIFSCCKFVRKQNQTLFISFVSLVADSISEGGILVPTLNELAIRYSAGFSRRLLPSEVWSIAAAQFLIDTVQIEDSYCSSIFSAGILYKSMNELLETGGETWLNITSMKDPLFSSVEFKVEKKTILNWFVDIMDNISLDKGVKINPDLNFRKVAGEGIAGRQQGKYYKDWSPLKKYLTKMDFYQPLKNISILKKIKKRRAGQSGYRLIKLDLNMDTQAGFTHTDFKPLDEDSQEEYDLSWEYETEWDDYEYSEDPDIPNISYVYLPSLNSRSLTSVRGTSWNLLVCFYHIDETVRSVHGNKNFFMQKSKKSGGIYSAFQSELKFMYLSESKNVPSLPGFERVDFERFNSMFKGNFKQETEIELKSGKFGKREIVRDSILCSELTSFDSYFKSMSIREVKKEIEKKKKVIDFVSANMFLDPNYDEQITELNNLMRANGFLPEESQNDTKTIFEHEEEETKQEEDNSNSGLQSLLNLQTGILGSISELGKGQLLTGGMVGSKEMKYQFKDPVDLITDKDFLSEIEALFPSFWKPIMNKEISMTKRQKQDRLSLAKTKIYSFPEGLEKQHYTRLYQILLFFLGEIPEKGGFNIVSNSFIVHLDSMFEFYDPDSINEGLSDFNTIFAKPPMFLPESLDFL